MSDEAKKPGGIDLSKLLKKKDPAADAQPAPPSSAKSAPGLDLAKLLSKPSPPETSPPTRQSAPPPEAPAPIHAPPGLGGVELLLSSPAKPAAAKPVPAKPAAAKPITPQPAAKPAPTQPVTKPAVTRAPSTQRPATATREAGVAAQSVTRFKASVEESSSRAGSKDLQLDLTVAEERKYPRGYFGVDEVRVLYDMLVDVGRRHLWRLRGHQREGFKIAFRVRGASFFSSTITYTREPLSLTETFDTYAEDATLHITHDSDTIVDQVRGRTSCDLMWVSAAPKLEGDKSLLYWLAINLQQIQRPEAVAEYVEESTRELEVRAKIIKTAEDPIDAVLKLMERDLVPARFDEPLFIRLCFAGPQTTEAIFHFQDGKVTTLRAKPGEALPPGAVELHIDEIALRAISEGETSYLFQMWAHHIRITGELSLVAKSGLVGTTQSARMVFQVHKTGQALGSANRLESELRLVGPAKDPYLDVY